MSRINRFLAKFGLRLSKLAPMDKQEAELAFWKATLEQYIQWYQGELPELYGEASPSEAQKVKANTLKDSAVLTWGRVHQQAKYLQDLALPEDAFAGLKLLDIGSGPIPSALAFRDCEIHCLDPLLPGYVMAGFPLHYYDRARFVHAPAESIPYPDDYFDAVISVNALDHVDDFDQAVREIRRALKPDGKLRFHLHYHTATPLEPVALNDQIVVRSFEWSRGFRKVGESRSKRGTHLSHADEIYTVWSNF